MVQMDEQYIHAMVFDLDHNLKYYITMMYAFNQLEKRKKLWIDIESIGSTIQQPWIVMGDFNNVITSKD